MPLGQRGLVVIAKCLPPGLLIVDFGPLQRGVDLDQTFLLLLCFCVGFISGFGVRAMISQYRRREARKAYEARHGPP
jgi:hypothetical protein